MSNTTENKFIKTTASIMRDMINALSADLSLHQKNISIGYVWDVDDRAFGWRVQITVDDVLGYAFSSDLILAIERVASGWRRISDGQSVEHVNRQDEQAQAEAQRIH